LKEKLAKFNTSNEGDNAFIDLQEIAKKIERLDGGSAPHATKVQAKLKEMAAAENERVADKEASSLLELLKDNIKPPQALEWYKKEVEAADRRAPALKERLKPVHTLLEDWKFVEEQKLNEAPENLAKRLAQRPDWPDWLKGKAQVKIAVARTGNEPASVPSTELKTTKLSPTASDQPDAHSRLPLYFVNGKDRLQKVRIEELRPELKFFLQPGIDKQGIKLSDANNNGKLRQLVNDDQASFTVDIPKKAIRLETGAGKHDLPFSLLAKDAMGTEVFRIWLVATANTPLFPQSTLGLSRKGNVLEFNPLALRINGAPKNQLLINLPDTCFAVSKESSELQPLVNWKFDLSAQRKIIEDGIVTLKQHLERLKKEVPEDPKNNQNQYVTLADQFEKAVKFTEEQKKRDFPEPNSLPRQKYGGYLQAISRNLKKSGDPVFMTGNNLKTLKSEITGKEVEDAFKKAERALKDARSSLDNPQEKAAHESHLNQLLDMLKLLRPETPQEKQAREMREHNRVTNIQGLEAKIRAVNPLTSEQVPPGTYRIFANDAGVNIPIVEIQVPQPNQP
jgi:hypothetical protein